MEGSGARQKRTAPPDPSITNRRENFHPFLLYAGNYFCYTEKNREKKKGISVDGLRLIVRKEGKEAMAALAGLRDPQAALLYAYAASRDGGCTEEEAAAALGLAPEQVHKAAELTVVYGLTARELTPPPRQEPAYSAGELVRAREGDPAFSGCAAILNRQPGESSTGGRWRPCSTSTRVWG
jgi:hypothetical protein